MTEPAAWSLWINDTYLFLLTQPFLQLTCWNYWTSMEVWSYDNIYPIYLSGVENITSSSASLSALLIYMVLIGQKGISVLFSQKPPNSRACNLPRWVCQNLLQLCKTPWKQFICWSGKKYLLIFSLHWKMILAICMPWSSHVVHYLM